MTNPDLTLQDRLLPPLERNLLLGLAPLVDSLVTSNMGEQSPLLRQALSANVPAILRTGRTLRYIEAAIARPDQPGWLNALAFGDPELKKLFHGAMSIGSEVLASHLANETLDGDQPRIKALTILIKQHEMELARLFVKVRRQTSWCDR